MNVFNKNKMAQSRIYGQVNAPEDFFVYHYSYIDKENTCIISLYCLDRNNKTSVIFVPNLPLLVLLELPHSRVWNVHEVEAICKNLFRSRNVPRYIGINLVRRKMLYYSHTNEDGTDKEFQFIEIEMPTVYSVHKLTEAVHNFTLFNTMMVGNPDLTMSSEDEFHKIC